MANENNGNTAKPKKPWYKRWWVWVLVALVVIIVAAGKGGSSDNSSNSSSSNNKQEQSSSKPKKNTAKATTLGAGTFEVGKDIQPGRYLIKAVSGSGNFQSEGGEDINIILGTSADSEGGQVDSYTTNLVKGEKIKISGIEQTSFEPAPKPEFKTTFGPGTWTVGQDIKPGRYEIKANSGSGNVMSNNGDINEILGTSADSEGGQVTHFTANLTNGETITSNVQEIQLINK